MLIFERKKNENYRTMWNVRFHHPICLRPAELMDLVTQTHRTIEEEY